MPENEAKLVADWLKFRDENRFRRIYERHAAMVHGVCERMAGPSAADDIAQECFIGLLQADNVPPAKLGGWLHTVATNRARDYLRSMKRRKRRESVYTESIASGDEPPWNDVKGLIDEAMEALPEELRLPLIAHFLRGESRDSIATREGITKRSVSYRIEKGLKLLRKRMQRQGVPFASATALGAMLSRHAGAEPTVDLNASFKEIVGSGKRVSLDTSNLANVARWKIGASIVAAVIVFGGAYTYLVPWQESPNFAPPTRVSTVESGTEAENVESTAPPGQGGETTLEPANEAGTVEPVSIAGTVFNSDGEGVANANVIVIPTGFFPPDPIEDGSYSFVYTREFSGFRFTLTDRARHDTDTTDALGRFAVEGRMEPGAALVVAEAPGLETGLTSVMLVPTEHHEVSVTLEEGVSLSGRVLSVEGVPVTDAVVRPVGFGQVMYDDAGNAIGGSGGTTAGLRISHTDYLGRFRLGFRGPGIAMIQVTSASQGDRTFGGIEPGGSEVQTFSYGPPALLAGTIRREDGGDVGGLSLSLQPLVAFSIEVGAGSGFGGGGGGSSHGGPAVKAQTSEDGTFLFEELDPGLSYELDVMDGDGRVLAKGAKPPKLNQGQRTHWDLVIESPITVRGRVLGESTGAPLEGLEVHAFKRPERMSMGMPQPTQTISDTDGSYELRIFTEPGEYEIKARYPVLDSSGFGGPDVEYHSLESGQELDLDLYLPEPVSAAFRAVDAAGEPVANARVAIVSDAGARSPRSIDSATGEDGLFAHGLLSPDKAFRVRFEHAEVGFGESATITGVPGETLPIEDVRLYKRSSARGKIVGPDEIPVSGWRGALIIYYEDKYLAAPFRTEDDGTFEVEDAVPATAVIFEIRAGFNRNRLIPNEWQTVEIEAAPGDTLDLGTIKLAEPSH